MVLSVSISEKVSAQHRVIGWSRPLGNSISLVHRIKVVCQRCKLGLRTQRSAFRAIPINNTFSKLKNIFTLFFTHKQLKLFISVIPHYASMLSKKIFDIAAIDLDSDKHFVLIDRSEAPCSSVNVPLHAFLGGSSCNRIVSGSWSTAGPTLMLYRNGSRPPKEPATLYYGTAWIFYGIDQAEPQLWNRKMSSMK